MSIVLANRATPGGTYLIDVPFKDENGIDIIPTSISWTLIDENGNIVNNRLNVAVSVPSALITIQLDGADLSLHGDSEEVRHLLVRAVYNNAYASGLIANIDIAFFVGSQIERSAIFIKSEIVAKLKSQHLALMQASGLINTALLTDDYIWQSIKMAESQLERKLGVFLTPTLIVPDTTSQTELDRLEQSGTRYIIDPGYDLDVKDMMSKWLWIDTRYMPIINVDSITFNLPYSISGYPIPSQWIKTDKRAGTIQLIPSIYGFSSIAPTAMTMIGWTTVPMAIKIKYTAGLQNALRLYPEIEEIVLRSSLSNIISGSWSPVGGSISIDGMSQSLGFASIEAFNDSIEKMTNKLKDNIVGIQCRVI